MATDLMMFSLGAAVACDNSTERIRNLLGEPQGRRAAAHRQPVVTAVTTLTRALTADTDTPK
ncbi:hypothetical protein ACWDG9_38085 [Streptomyces sp. NPDC001073]|uniref:hypothetical protein n=1 Tax=Streptomyces sp. NPDC001642 TaxID=3154392 RepID=UPI003331CC4F